MLNAIQSFAKDESGATAVEYGLIAVLLCVAMLGGLESAGLSINSLWEGNATKANTAMDNW